MGVPFTDVVEAGVVLACVAKKAREGREGFAEAADERGNPCPSCKPERPEIVDVFLRLLKHDRHAKSLARSTDNGLLPHPVTPPIGARESGTSPAARDAQALGEASTGFSCRSLVLGVVLEVCERMAGDVARIAP